MIGSRNIKVVWNHNAILSQHFDIRLSESCFRTPGVSKILVWKPLALITSRLPIQLFHYPGFRLGCNFFVLWWVCGGYKAWGPSPPPCYMVGFPLSQSSKPMEDIKYFFFKSMWPWELAPCRHFGHSAIQCIRIWSGGNSNRFFSKTKEKKFLLLIINTNKARGRGRGLRQHA